MKLDLACGINRMGPDYVGVDVNPKAKADVVLDLLDEPPWPWEADSVDEIYCSHFIEHIPMGVTSEGRDKLVEFFFRCWTVLKPEGTMTVRYPVCTSDNAYGDPTHRRFLSRLFLSYLSAPWRENGGIGHYDAPLDFEATVITMAMDDKLAKRPDALFLMDHYWNAANEVRATLVAKKPSRTAGIQNPS